MNVVYGSQVAPEIQPPKKNNYIPYQGGGYIIQRIKCLIAFQTFLGINRLYLVGCRNCVKGFCFTYTLILVLADATTIILQELYSTSELLFKHTVAIEYILIAFSALFLQRKPLKNFFTKLQSLDEKLNIREDINLTTPTRIYIIGSIAIILYCSTEQLIYSIYIAETFGAEYAMYASLSGSIVHDTELLFFSVLLVMVSRRLRVIKAHVAKIFSMCIEKDGNEEINKLEALSKKTSLDVTALHNAYDLLYKCSLELTRVMTLPIIVMIVAAGLSTILILKNLIQILQVNQNPSTGYDLAVKFIIIISVGRTLKYILLLMVPCYFATVTKTQVDVILTLLHDILNNNNRLDKVERRKLKAFSQLCRDNGFTYELWGVVRLDMSLPLGYSSLCTTYLIIFVQFSKFID